MPNITIAFDQPWWLVLLLLIPVLWVFSFQSLSGLGPYRRIFALLFRTIVFTLLVLALAGVQLQKISDRMTVIYLLDQSESIPKLTREAMLEYVMKDIQSHRRQGDLTSATEDKAGVIIFGREATIEYPPLAAEIQAVGRLESLFDLRTDATNIASALKLAQASFPEDSAKRIVIVTDGNENLGDSRTVARTLADSGIGIDVVPIVLDAQSEIAVEKIALPPDIRRGQPIEARVVIENYTKPDPAKNPTGEISGRLRVTRRYGNQDEPLSASPDGAGGDMQVTLKPGKNVFSFQHTIDVPAGYTYRADFVPDDAQADVMLQNNTATTFTHVRGKGRVLLIEDWESPGEFDYLIQRLGEKNIEVEKMPSDRLFTSLAELQGFDCVVLANVPRASGGETDKRDATNFSDEQIAMLVRNTEQFGCGLVMLGGNNSFGAGGWTNTEIEKAMPVDFQIKNAKVKAVGALVMMLHASEIPEGNHWQKVIAEEALKVLGPSDYCGCINWDNFTSKENWLWKDAATGKGLARIEDRQKIWMGRISRMAPGDMPDFEPSMKMALTEFLANPASIKHMIVISDGDPSPPNPGTLARYKAAGIKVSTVAVGAHGPAESALLQRIATTTGGKYYQVNSPKALPRIFQIEARRVARPLVKEDSRGIPIVVDDPAHEMLVGLSPPQPVTGFVLTSTKENPLVEVLMRAKDIDPENGTILAAWRYGAGKSVAFTSDAGKRWAHAWTGSDEYDKFFSQMIRYAMRPVNEEGKFNVATDVKDGQVRVVVTALDKNDDFLNFLNMSGAGTGPEMSSVDVQFRQDAPGRYVAEFPADKAGSYLLAVNTGQANAPPLLAGITVPYSAEFRERETNRALITTLASTKPTGGQAGRVIEGPLVKGAIDRLVASTDTFRRTLAKALSSRDFWPIFLLIAACVFLGDVFIRRVTVHFYWVMPALAVAYNRVLGRQPEAAPDERLARLRNRKAAIATQIDERRAATRFEPVVDEAAQAARDASEILADAAGGAAAASAQQPARTTQSQTPQT
jgi:uncharacterized membrane protein/Mg-chelatase subunit ChlD